MPARAANPRKSRPARTTEKPARAGTSRAASNGRLGASTNGAHASAGKGSASAQGAASSTRPRAAGWEYAPAPESVKVDIAPTYGHFIGGRFVEPSEGTRFPTINPGNEKVLSQIAQGSARDVDAAVAAATDALPAWAALSGKERGKYLYRIARRIQERARELAVLETMDGGKTIKESRDIDIPLAAAHFFYHAGWADKLQYAFAGRTPRPVGVCGQIIPWNFPLLMAAWKLAPRSRAATPSSSNPPRPPRSPRSASPRSSRRSACHAASSTSSPAMAAPAPRSSNTPASTRSPSPAPPRSASASPRPSRAPASASRSNSAARAPTSSSRMPASIRPSRASSRASTSTRATSAAPARGCSCRSPSSIPCGRSLRTG
ncbi:MAG: aldehyde dehydrogenase family protein [Phycisphaeraceae bacterium]|nr:aldehyde dehydrogenase family protein [Phycisphaeraceae bacterium]